MARSRDGCVMHVYHGNGLVGGARVTQASVSGTEGYAEQAAELFERYESIAAADAHRAVLHLMPAPPSRVLDIGSGTGRDAAWLAAKGHRVVAVEPTAALRKPAMARHRSPLIEWLDDSLPDLALVRTRGDSFALVMLTAVWMHLDASQRRQAMPNLAALLRDGGTMILSLRHGPVPPGRRMFEVPADETIELAAAHRLHPVLNLRVESSYPPDRAAGVDWTRLAFVKMTA
jgi:SAM-dependent methyltransferase